MPGGYGNINGNDGNTFSSENQPKNRGRKPSIRNQLKHLLEQDGKITIPASQIVKVKDNGDVVMKLPTQEQMAMKLVSWAMSSKGNPSLRAIQMVVDQIDGKPSQEIEHKAAKGLKIVISDGDNEY